MQKKATKKSVLKQMERWTSIDLSIIKRIRIINQMHVIFHISNRSYIFLKHTHVHVAFYAWQIYRQSWFNRKYETFTWITSYRCHKAMIGIKLNWFISLLSSITEEVTLHDIEIILLTVILLSTCSFFSITLEILLQPMLLKINFVLSNSVLSSKVETVDDHKYNYCIIKGTALRLMILFIFNSVIIDEK